MSDIKAVAQRRFTEVARGSKIGIPSGKFRWAFKSSTGCSDEEINSVFSILDGDGNGYVSMDEFLKWVEDPSNGQMAKLYLGMDKDAPAAAPAPGGGAKPAQVASQPPAPAAKVQAAPPVHQGRAKTNKRASVTGMRPDHAAEIFALLDNNGNKSIDIGEWELFNGLVRRLSPELVDHVSSPRSGAHAAFKAADTDNNGQVDEKEWMEYMSAIVITIGERAWDEAAGRVKKELHQQRKAGPAPIKGVNPNIQKISFKVKTATVKNHLITLQEAKYISEQLQNGTAEQCIVTLSLTKTLTDGSDANRELAQGIAKAVGLDKVYVDGIEIPRKNILFVGPEGRGEFRDERKVTELDWTKLGFDSSDGDDLMVFILSEFLKDKRCCLTKVLLHPKQLGVDSANALGDALKVNRTLTYVRFGANFPLHEIRDNKIEEIDWTAKEVNSCDIIVLVSLLKENKSVKVLKLSENKICARGAEALCEVLKTSKQIVAVDLSLNPDLGDDAMMVFSQMLKVNKQLQVLMLKGTSICDNGAMSLAEALPKCGLKKLYLEYNKIGGAGCAKLANAVSDSPHLKELHLQNNQIPQPVKAQCGADPKRVFF